MNQMLMLQQLTNQDQCLLQYVVDVFGHVIERLLDELAIK
jgi:hypothetical protein